MFCGRRPCDERAVRMKEYTDILRLRLCVCVGQCLHSWQAGRVDLTAWSVWRGVRCEGVSLFEGRFEGRR